MKEIDYNKEFSQLEEMKGKLKEIFESNKKCVTGDHEKLTVGAAKAYAEVLQAQMALKPENCR